MTKALDAYSENRYELAMPMFECVLRSGDELQKLHADYFLARIFADDTSGFVDHAHAYTLFQGISESADTVDPDDSRRAPFVAKAVTAIAGYVRRGLPEIGLKSDIERAVEYYRTAATTFNEPDAQFELGKLHLTGTGVAVDIPLGLHYIQKLVQDGHAGAQAFLAEQHWAGTYAPMVTKDHPRALALSKLAVENANPSDRLWIEDKYQNFYCGTSTTERTRAAEVAGTLRQIFARGAGTERTAKMQKAAQPPMSLGRRQPTPSRSCSNGEAIDMDLRGAAVAVPMASSLTEAAPQQTMPAGLRPRR